MVSAVFQQAVKEATGTAWEEWIEKLERTLDPMWSHEQMKNHICGTFYLSDEWGEWLAVMYGQRLGRKPVGVTKDAGVQIGVRKTLAATKETLDREHGRFPAGKRIRLFFCGRRDRPTYGRSAVRMAAHDMETSGMGQAVPAANPSAARVIGQNDGSDPSGNAGRRLHSGIDAAALGRGAAPNENRNGGRVLTTGTMQLQNNVAPTEQHENGLLVCRFRAGKTGRTEKGRL